MIHIALHFIALFYLLGILVAIFLRSGGRVNVAVYVVGLYFLSVFGSLFLDAKLAAPYDSYSLMATFYFLFLLTLFFIPLILFDTSKIVAVETLNWKLFDIVCYIFIFVGVVSYAYFLPKIYLLISSLNDLKAMRGNLVGVETNLGGDLIYLFITLGCQFYPVVLLFYFNSACYRPERKWFNRFLLFSSTAYIVNVLAGVGRDGFVLWTMSYVFSFILYRNVLSSELKKKNAISLLALLLLFSIFFLAISVSRFYRDGSFYIFFQYLLLYFSQQFGEFNRFFVEIQQIEIDVVKIFPITDIFLSPVNEKDILSDHEDFLANHGFNKYVFKTFLGMFYENLGAWGTFFTSFLFFFFSFIGFLLGSAKKVNLGKLIYVTVFAQISLHGIFYYKLGYMVSNIYMLLSLFLCFAFSYRFLFKR